MSRRRDEGTTVVEFVAATTLVAVLLIGLIQVASYAYAGNVARHAAHEGARVGAEFGRSGADGASVASRALADDLGGTGRRYEVRGRRVGDRSVVDVSGPAPRLLPFVPTLSVHAHAEVAIEDETR